MREYGFPLTRILWYKDRIYGSYTGEYGSVKTLILAYFMQCKLFLIIPWLNGNCLSDCALASHVCVSDCVLASHVLMLSEKSFLILLASSQTGINLLSKFFMLLMLKLFRFNAITYTRIYNLSSGPHITRFSVVAPKKARNSRKLTPGTWLFGASLWDVTVWNCSNKFVLFFYRRSCEILNTHCYDKDWYLTSWTKNTDTESWNL